MARVVARRAERRLWSLNRVDPVPENILKYINRLSDLFFVMARAEMLDSGMAEERWRSFCYRKQR
jgi:cob(I)alamin adenosyltransferase